MALNITRDDIETAYGWAAFDPNEDVRTDYSGRGMFGRTCLAFTGDDPTTFIVAVISAALVREDGDTITCWDVVDALGGIGDTRTDDMGLGTVTYWPDLAVEG